MRKFIALFATAFVLTGCAGLASMLAANATVVSIVDGIRAGCGWEANSADVQALMNSGIIGLKTVDNYVGAFCAAVNNLPVASVKGAAPPTVVVGGVPVRATRR